MAEHATIEQAAPGPAAKETAAPTATPHETAVGPELTARVAAVAGGVGGSPATGGTPRAVQRATTPGLLALQRSAGNGAVRDLVRRRPQVQRAPKGAVVMDGDFSVNGVPANQIPKKPEPVEIEANSLDEAVGYVAEALGDPKDDVLIIGLAPKALIVYDKRGARLTGRLVLNLPKGFRPAPGLYVAAPGGISHQMLISEGGDLSVGTVAGIVQQAEKKKGAKPPPKPAPKQGTSEPGKAPPPRVFSLREYIENPMERGQFDATVAQHPKAWNYFAVPIPIGGKSGGQGSGDKASRFQSDLTEGGSGPSPNAPPWPVRMEGPKMQPLDSEGTFKASIDWGANGNYDLASQAISAVGNYIHYRWEVFDVTEYAKKHAADVIAHSAAAKKRLRESAAALEEPTTPPTTTGGAPTTTGGAPTTTGAGATGPPTTAPVPETPPPSADITMQPNSEYADKLEELKRSKRGSGKEQTGAEARDREFQRDFEHLWKDTKRAARDLADLHGDTFYEQSSNATANVLALQLLPVSFLITTIGASLRWIADLFAGERTEMDIPAKQEGVFLVRVITIPQVRHDRKGNPVIRPPSVASVVVEVVSMERMVKEGLEGPEADLEQARTDLKQAQAAKNPDAARIASLEANVRMKELEARGDPGELIKAKIQLKEAELEAAKKRWGGVAKGPIYKVEQELEVLRDRLSVFEFQEAGRVAGSTGLGQPHRLNATLISEVTGQNYPLLISAGPMAPEGGEHRWKILDATGPAGVGFIGQRKTPSGALYRALEKFAGEATYGRGTIGVRVPASVPLEQGAPREFRLESAPRDWAIAKSRIDDLVATLAALGLFVASAGTAAAVIGAAVAAARIIDRLNNGTLHRFDGQLVGDLLAVLGGAGVIAQGAAQAGVAIRVRSVGKHFVMVEEGVVTEAQLMKAAKALRTAKAFASGVEIANEALNYAGLVWGNLTFIDTMLDIAAQEAAGTMTKAEARRQRSMAIGRAINENGMAIAGNAIKRRQAAKDAAQGETGGGAPPRDQPGGTTRDEPGGTGTRETPPTEGGEGTTQRPGTTPGEETTTGGSRQTGESGVTGGTRPPTTGGAPREGGGTTGGSGTGITTGGTTGRTGEPGGQPARRTAAQERAAAHENLQNAARGAGDLDQAAHDAIGKGSWKEDLRGAVDKLTGKERSDAERALVEAREKIVNDAWAEVRKDFPDLWMENAGTKSFDSDIDVTVRPVDPKGPIGDQVKRAAEAGQRLSDAIRRRVGGETDIAIDTNVYSFIGEGRVSTADPTGRAAQQHVDMLVGLAEQLRGQSEANFRAFEQRLGRKLQDPAVGGEAKALLAEARKFHDDRAKEWSDARAKAKAEHPKEPSATVDRIARDELLATKKRELGDLLSAAAPDHGAISRKQSEINWFAPDAYATPSAFKQAVAHGQRLRGSQRTASEIPGKEVAAKLREASKRLDPADPRAQKLLRDATLVESQQRILESTMRELAAEQAQSPMDGERIQELERRAKGLRDQISKAAEKVVINEILGETMPADRPSWERLSEASAASGANLGMLESHVAHAATIDGKVKAACKYAGRISMAEFLGGLKPSDQPVARLIDEFVKSRMGVFEDAPSAIVRDMLVRYAELVGRSDQVRRNAQDIPTGVTDALKARFVNDVRSWARATNESIQAASIGAKAMANPTPGAPAPDAPAGAPPTRPAGGGAPPLPTPTGPAPTPAPPAPEGGAPAHTGGGGGGGRRPPDRPTGGGEPAAPGSGGAGGGASRRQPRLPLDADEVRARDDALREVRNLRAQLTRWERTALDGEQPLIDWHRARLRELADQARDGAPVATDLAEIRDAIQSQKAVLRPRRGRSGGSGDVDVDQLPVGEAMLSRLRRTARRKRNRAREKAEALILRRQKAEAEGDHDAARRLDGEITQQREVHRNLERVVRDADRLEGLRRRSPNADIREQYSALRKQLKRAGRLDYEVQIPMTDPVVKAEIMAWFEENLAPLAEDTVGQVLRKLILEHVDTADELVLQQSPRGAGETIRNTPQMQKLVRDAVRAKHYPPEYVAEFEAAARGHPDGWPRTGERVWEVDHVGELWLGGPDSPLNYLALPPGIHELKSDILTRFREKYREQHKRPGEQVDVRER